MLRRYRFFDLCKRGADAVSTLSCVLINREDQGDVLLGALTRLSHAGGAEVPEVPQQPDSMPRCRSCTNPFYPATIVATSVCMRVWLWPGQQLKCRTAVHSHISAMVDLRITGCQSRLHTHLSQSQSTYPQHESHRVIGTIVALL